MVFYECVVTAKNTAHFHQLTSIMKRISYEIIDGGGIVRGIHNHGIRDLPHRFKAKYADRQGVRYYELGRFISIYYEANPITMRQVEQLLTMDEDVLRNTHLKARSILDFVNITRENRNPFVKAALKEKNASSMQDNEQIQVGHEFDEQEEFEFNEQEVRDFFNEHDGTNNIHNKEYRHLDQSSNDSMSKNEGNNI